MAYNVIQCKKKSKETLKQSKSLAKLIVFAYIFVNMIDTDSTSQDPDWLEEDVLEGFVAGGSAEEGHLLNIHLVNHLVKFPLCSPQC